MPEGTAVAELKEGKEQKQTRRWTRLALLPPKPEVFEGPQGKVSLKAAQTPDKLVRQRCVAIRTVKSPPIKNRERLRIQTLQPGAENKRPWWKAFIQVLLGQPTLRTPPSLPFSRCSFSRRRLIVSHRSPSKKSSSRQLQHPSFAAPQENLFNWIADAFEDMNSKSRKKIVQGLKVLWLIRAYLLSQARLSSYLECGKVLRETRWNFEQKLARPEPPLQPEGISRNVLSEEEGMCKFNLENGTVRGRDVYRYRSKRGTMKGAEAKRKIVPL
ncbi:hypothetical protein DFH27DRAFT_544920 [Peziza echinospora]|nr:hypothetical protein DFH27DRAFT_544920 [Peziza echinospora]